ncbi:hypothetical protein JCM14719A_22930 [Calditerricola satsumensis]|uniref:Uncharacterized protein n=1 Tax=Calditerricola satsumensis TaxID=373054 RepID=A0A8J3BAY4_9BACI|nr:hypothetical protein GCM10007043_13390 [Calditerricola satsumensis]
MGIGILRNDVERLLANGTVENGSEDDHGFPPLLSEMFEQHFITKPQPWSGKAKEWN